jgi:hypothetical protein
LDLADRARAFARPLADTDLLGRLGRRGAGLRNGALPALMFFHGWTALSQVPTMLLVEVVLLNGLLSILAAWVFKRSGFLAAVGLHFWTDIVWHVLWGLF